MSVDYLSNVFSYNSIVIITMFLISLFALILNEFTNGKSNHLFFESYRSSPLNPLTYLRLFTHSLGHADFDHFMNNYITILLIGPLLEEKYGSIDLLVMILITSFVIGLFNLIRGGVKLRGASGIVFMMIVLSSFSNISEGKIPITFILIFLFYVVKEFGKLSKSDGVSHSGHIVGALCGVGFGFMKLYNLNWAGLILAFINLF